MRSRRAGSRLRSPSRSAATKRAIARSWRGRQWRAGGRLRISSVLPCSWRATRHASSPAPCSRSTVAIRSCEELIEMPAPAQVRDPEPRMPYQLPMPKEASADIVIASVLPEDERVWVPQAPNVWFRPLCLNASQGYWVNLLKVTRSGVLSRHRHTNPVHGFVLKGRWHYLEHDWVATEGGYVYEPPGETHTLVVPEDVAEMITLFQVN